MKVKIAITLAGCAIASQLFGIQPTEAARKNSKTDIVINVVGDVHGESPVKRGAIAALKPYLADGSLNIFNLETAITSYDQKEEKAYNFRADPAFLRTLKSAGFNLASVANNHSYDFGETGFLDTLKNLDSVGIPYVGGGVNSASAYQGRIFTIKGMKIGVLGFAKVNGGPLSIAGREKPGTTNGYDAASTERAVVAMRSKSDILIIVAHWGEEGNPCPRSFDSYSARKWLALGADIIVGSHPHILQPIKLEKNKLVAYSLGNFIFYSSKIENRTTGILQIRISPTKRISYLFKPMVINNLTKVPEPANTAIDPSDGCVNQEKTTVR